MSPRLQRNLFAASICILVLCGIKAGYDLWNVLLWEWRGATDKDALNYFYVARGLLSGMDLYRDIYEAKPPGIFWLMISSLLTTGDQRFLSVVQVGMFLSLPLLFAAYAYEECRRAAASALRMLWISGSGFLIGALLALYLEERTGMLQTESFGGFFGALYAMSTVWGEGVHSKKRIALSSALLFASLWMKEPFVLTTLAAAIVLCRGRQAFVRSFIFPLLAAGIAYVLLLVAFGYFDAYITIHLPAMIWGRVSHDPLDPVWLRWLSVRWLYSNLTAFFYPAPLFGYLLILLLGVAVVARLQNPSPSTVAWALGSTFVGVLFLLYAYVLGILLNAWMLHAQIQGGYWMFGIHRFPWILVPILTLMVLPFAYRKKLLLPIGTVLAGLCLSSQAVGISVYTDNHFAFAFPFYAALLLLFLSYGASRASRLPLVAVVSAFTLLIAFQYRTDEKHMRTLEERSHFTYAEHKPVVDRFDAMLDACSLPNFYSLNAWQTFAYARHPHVGPMVILGFVDYLPKSHYLIQQTLVNIRDTASVLITSAETTELISPPMDIALREIFTEDAPACAQPFLPIAGHNVMFRKTAAINVL